MGVLKKLSLLAPVNSDIIKNTILPAVQEIANDKHWRIREAVLDGLPNMAKAAGLKPTQIPKLAKMVKGNIGLLADIPKETKSLIDEITSTFKLIQSTFAG